MTSRTRMSRLDGPVWLAFHHEPEGDGDIRDWTAMQERLAPIVRQAAPNVAFSVILTGWNQLYGDRQYALDKLWPQDTKIDLVGFDVYNKYGVERPGRATTSERTEFERGYFPKFRDFAGGTTWPGASAETGHTDRSATVDAEVDEAHLHSRAPARRRRAVLLQHHAEQHRALAAQRD